MKNWVNRNSQTRTRRLNGRQRKKYHLAEFKEFGFRLQLRFKHLLSDTELDQWIDDLCAASQRLSLLVGGFASGQTQDQAEGFVAAEVGSTSEAQREAFADFVRQHPLVASVEVGPLIDGWYSND